MHYYNIQKLAYNSLKNVCIYQLVLYQAFFCHIYFHIYHPEAFFYIHIFFLILLLILYFFLHIYFLLIESNYYILFHILYIYILYNFRYFLYWDLPLNY